MSLKRKSTIFHSGKQVTIHNYVGIKKEECVPAIKLLTADITSGKDHDILLLIDFTGCTAAIQKLPAKSDDSRDDHPSAREW